MTEVNKEELRRLAEKATPGEWWIDSHGNTMVSHGDDRTYTIFQAMPLVKPAVRHPETGNLSHWPNDWDASFIAAANPAAVLSLLDENEALLKQVAALQSDENSWQSGYDKGREMGAKHRAAEVEQLRAEVERRQAMTAVTCGVGDGSGKLFVHGDYDSIKRVQALVFEVEALRKDVERLDRLDIECEAYGCDGIHEGNRWMIDGPFRTVRDAIDAAMGKEGGANG